MKVNFPPDGFITPPNLRQLEQLLPPREEVMIPEDAEEHDLVKIDPETEARRRRQHSVSQGTKKRNNVQTDYLWSVPVCTPYVERPAPFQIFALT